MSHEQLTQRHGGPGGGVASTDTVYFDPKVYRIVLFDQRGAGKSEPYVLITDPNDHADNIDPPT